MGHTKISVRGKRDIQIFEWVKGDRLISARGKGHRQISVREKGLRSL